MAKAKSTASFFEKHSHQMNLWAESGGVPALRKCQLGAYWAVWSHFTTSENPALVSLPTGAGKTALMIALAFGLKAKRVLIITPAAVLRDQVSDDFASLKLLKSLNVLPTNLPLPSIFASESQRSTVAKWKEFEKYDVVVATPKTTSPGEAGVCDPPDGLFDLVLIDEAHHTPAPTWSAIVRAFSKARTVLLTATAFRRDRRRIRASLVYHYSIGRAVNDGIYRSIDFHAVKHDKSRSKQDKLLCDEAIRVFKSEKSKGNNAQVLIRTSNVGWSDRLIQIYTKAGLKVETVDYTKNLADNESVIRRVRSGTLDGMICVGMVGEGLDVPELKIAVLHSAPRSLPFTLQFVGRVARTNSGQTGNAHLIADPDEVRGEVRSLYRSDANWRKLIPKLVDDIVGKTTSGQAHFSSQNSIEQLDLDPNSLKPFFSVTVFATQKNGVNLSQINNSSDEFTICLQELMCAGEALAIVTEREDEPPWAKETAITESSLSLHVFYYDKSNQLLFEATTLPSVANKLRSSIAVKDLFEIDPTSILQVMQNVKTADYFMVGLRNTLGRGVSQPTYKTLMGSQVQAAIRPVEGKTFGPGHVLAKVSADETRGVATGNSRVWAIQRGSISELVVWCKSLASDLKRNVGSKSGLPQLGFLAKSETVQVLVERPIAVLVDEQVLFAKKRIEVTVGDDVLISSNVPDVVITNFTSGVLHCTMEFLQNEPPIAIQCDLSKNPTWQLVDSRQVRFRTELSDADIVDGDFQEFQKHFPLTLVMPNGGIIRGNTLWTPEAEAGLLPIDCLVPKMWNGCDITCEDGTAMTGTRNVQDYLEDMLVSSLPADTIVIKDHGTGEIADLIIVQPKDRVIGFYHCKAAAKAKGGKTRNPGAQVDDLYEVLGQACRNRLWVRSPQIMLELVSRIETGNRATAIVSGQLSSLKQVAQSFISNAWNYEVIAVQPGILCDKAKTAKNLNKLITATSEWLVSSGAKFFVWGS
jgi:superfamily II DNA or RNA helicase